MNRFKKIFFELALMFLVVLGCQTVKASEFNFSVNPILPDNQVDSKVGYYNLLMDPGQKQTVEVQLANQTKKSITVDIAIASATTNLNGVVEYSPNDIKPDSSLKYNIKNLAKVPSKVNIPAQSTKNVEIEVTMPTSTFPGVIAGGITFKQDSSQIEPDSKSNSKGISIKNQYQFVVGLLMQQTDTVVPPVLSLKNVTPAQVNYRNVINANFQNSAMGYLKNMVVDAHVTIKGKSEVLYEVQKDSMTMAPNSNFDFPMSLSGDRFKPGTYTYTADVYGLKKGDGNYTYGKDINGNPQHYAYHWEFTKDFTIRSTKASELNEKDVTVKADNSWLYWLIGALALILIALIIFIILWKHRKKDKDGKDKTSF